jgi:hypothetical protein
LQSIFRSLPFRDGKGWPRFGLASDAWGYHGCNCLPSRY